MRTSLLIDNNLARLVQMPCSNMEANEVRIKSIPKNQRPQLYRSYPYLPSVTLVELGGSLWRRRVYRPLSGAMQYSVISAV